MKSYRMTYSTLRQYLISQPFGSFVGVRTDDCKCPVANAYLSILPKGSGISVSDDRAYIYLPGHAGPKIAELPKFVKRFIRKHVDGSGPVDSNVKREDALEMLEAAYGTRNIYRATR